MTREKAIQILTALYKLHQNGLVPDEEDAIKLAITHITYVENVCRYPHEAANLPIPGETPIIDNTRSLHAIKKVLESPLGVEPKG